VTRRRDDDRPAAELDDVAVGQFLIDADGRDRCRRQLSLDPVEYGLFPGFQVGCRAGNRAADEGRVGLMRPIARMARAMSGADPGTPVSTRVRPSESRQR
jgi:hypothetical protein